MADIIQLNPSIPVFVEEKGAGEAIFLVRDGREHHNHWIVIIDSTCEIWEVPNNKLRGFKNWTLERTKSSLDNK